MTTALCCVVLLTLSCRSTSDTVIVNTPVILPTPEVRQDENESIPRYTIRYGEIDPIVSMDPLFALNNATLRFINLLYEGLVKTSPELEITPGLATSWEVSGDSLVYTFTIRKNVFFHNAPVFTSGLGRRFEVHDVLHVFERMASRDVPPDAAELFTDVLSGFDSYNREKRSIYIPSRQFLTNIPGIQIKNDSTVVFILAKKDPHFLMRLASPMAAIYPVEAAAYLNNRAVGTGPFLFESNSGDSLYVLKRNPDHYSTENSMNGIEVHRFSSENQLFRAISGGKIDMIPEIGPVTFPVVIRRGSILHGYHQDFSTIETRGYDYLSFLYNPDHDSGISNAQILAIIQSLPADTLKAKLNGMGFDTIRQNMTLNRLPASSYRNAVDSLGLTVLFKSDYLEGYAARFLYSLLRTSYNPALITGNVVSREAVFFTEQHSLAFPDSEHAALAPNEWLRIQKPRYVLFRENVNGLRFNSYVWWMDLTKVSISDPSPNRQIQ